MSYQRDPGAEPIPGYRLIERLGSGGFGEVWKAEAPGGILKAIKFVYGDLSAGEDGHRAEQELKALNRVKSVRHPYILSLERIDITDGQLMIVMELADSSLWDRYKVCKSQNLPGIPRDELIRHMEESAEALDLMNIQHQLQHLDIKPQNLFLVYNHVKVADFGLVKDLEGMVASVTGGVTPVYAAPETFEGMVTRFCDQYSLAIVYQELLTGQRPFTGTNVHQLVMQHITAAPNLAPLPPDDQPIIGRALSKSPDDRYPSCAEMARALAHAQAPARVVVESVPKQEDRPKTESGFFASPARVVAAAATTVKPVADTPVATDTKKGGPPPEKVGEGELFPALVIGLGGMGLNVLKMLRTTMTEHFGDVSSLPHISMVGIDTDPEVHHLPSGGARPAFPISDIVLARLQRPLHYQKSKEGRPRIEDWFNTNALYRISRNLTTGGIRALGRLAFIDNYRAIAQRLRSELQSCTDSDALDTAMERTGLKLRINRPRVYIVAALGGGTASGMFLDVAYWARQHLKQMGYERPDIVGLFFLPGVDPKLTQKKALINSYAAMSELNHYSSANVNFTTKFDEREGIVKSDEPPYNRCLLVPLPLDTTEDAVKPPAQWVSDFLYRDMLTPLGRIVDMSRLTVPPPSKPPRSLLCQSFGKVRFSWPRKTLLARSARRLCQRLVQKWGAKASQAIQEQSKAWAVDFWTKKELDAKFMIERLQASCEKVLGKAAESVFASLNEAYVQKGWFGSKYDAKVLRDSWQKFEKMLGTPAASSVLIRPGTLEDALRQEAGAIALDWDTKVIEAISKLVDQPEHGLAGGEEILQQISIMLDQVIKHHDPLLQEFTQKAAACHERLLQVLMPNLEEILSGARGTAQFHAELLEFMKAYPKVRYQSLILKHVTTIYKMIKDRLSEQLREVGTVRKKLGDLAKAYDAGPASDQQADSELFFQLLPPGCQTLDQAVDQFCNRLTPIDIDELNKRLENVVRQQFRGLLHVCTSSGTLFKNLEFVLLEESVNFASSKFEESDIIALLLDRYLGDDDLLRVLYQAFEAAKPKISLPGASGRTEVTVLAAPTSSQTERFRKIASRVSDDHDLMPAPSPDDIVIYREDTQLGLNDLQQASNAIAEAYRQATAADVSNTHTRTDVEWRALG